MRDAIEGRFARHRNRAARHEPASAGAVPWVDANRQDLVAPSLALSSSAAHLGVDLYASDRLLLGLSAMRSAATGTLAVNDDPLPVTTVLYSLNPYLYWNSERGAAWAIAGVGGGELAVGRHAAIAADSRFNLAAAGVRLGRPDARLHLRADAHVSELIASDSTLPPHGLASQARLLVEWTHNRPMTPNRALHLTLAAGARADRNDDRDGLGAELTFRAQFADDRHGLDLSLYGRALTTNGTEHTDWSLGAQGSWDPGRDYLGFRATVASGLGLPSNGAPTLWAAAPLFDRPSHRAPTGPAARSRAEWAYATPLPARARLLLTPYAAHERGAGARADRIGLRLGAPPTAAAAHPGPISLEVEAARVEHVRPGPPDLQLSIRLQGGLR